MSAELDPTKHLTDMRALANKLEQDLAESEKANPAKPGSLRQRASKLVTMFQELDSALTEGGDAPAQWAGDE